MSILLYKLMNRIIQLATAGYIGHSQNFLVDRGVIKTPLLRLTQSKREGDVISQSVHIYSRTQSSTKYIIFLRRVTSPAASLPNHKLPGKQIHPIRPPSPPQPVLFKHLKQRLKSQPGILRLPL